MFFPYPLSVSWCFLSWSLVRSWWSFWSLLSILLVFPELYWPGLIPMAWNMSWAVIGEGPAPSLPSLSWPLLAWHDGKILVIWLLKKGYGVSSTEVKKMWNFWQNVFMKTIKVKAQNKDCRAVNSPKKWTNKFLFLSLNFDFKFQVFLSRKSRRKNLFVPFLGEVLARQFCFDL